MSKKLIRDCVVVGGLAAAALAGAAGIAGAATQAGAGAALRSADGGQSRPVRAPFATRAESLRLARRMLAKVVLPEGTHRFLGRKLPAALRSPSEQPSSDHIVDLHRVFAGRRSMSRTFAFLIHHHPVGWSLEGRGSGYGTVNGKQVLTEEGVAYVPRRIRPGFNQVSLLVDVVPGRHGQALIRVDAQVVWYPRRSAAEYLVARRFVAVRVDEFSPSGSAHRTFRQRAIIEKLTRVLNSLPASPGGTWNCPMIDTTYQLTFEPVKGKPDAVVQAQGCAVYDISVGGRGQPALTENGTIEETADRLLRGSHKPER